MKSALLIALIGCLACKAPTPSASEKVTPHHLPSMFAAYRGVAWGATESEARQVIGFTECTSPAADPLFNVPRHYCLSSFKLGDVKVEDEFDFFAGRFLSGGGNFSADDFESVRETFIAKYGRPQAETSGMLMWQIEGSTITLSRRGVLEGQGQYSFGSREFNTLYENAKAAKAAKAKEARKTL